MAMTAVVEEKDLPLEKLPSDGLSHQYFLLSFPTLCNYDPIIATTINWGTGTVWIDHRTDTQGLKLNAARGQKQETGKSGGTRSEDLILRLQNDDTEGDLLKSRLVNTNRRQKGQEGSDYRLHRRQLIRTQRLLEDSRSRGLLRELPQEGFHVGFFGVLNICGWFSWG
ncbi:hypothetical protein P7K49_031912 [Saguinus oedipus]|uniref:Uncharacterized protein n=1 Tax=Saguinus oedipus TaxID=9490 RepID=A0ABQ9U1M9_SAGOE|nr:hypothetical protein P7K49_031912 [Saguinus oedipus]